MTCPVRRLRTSRGTRFGLSEFGLRPEEIEIGLQELSMCPQDRAGGQAQVGGDDENSDRVGTAAQRSEHTGPAIAKIR